MTPAEFQIERNRIVDELEAFRLKYEKFLNNVSPKNWRTAGGFNTDLKQMHTKIQDFQQITEQEKNIDWVKEQLAK